MTENWFCKRLSLLLFIILMVITITHRTANAQFANETEHISYNEFLQLIRENKLEEVIIYPTRIKGTLYQIDRKGKITVITGRVDDPNLVKELVEHRVKFSAAEETGWRPGLFFLWIVPMILFLILISRLRYGAGGAGLMSIGKSRATLYIDIDTGVTFDDVAGVDEAKEELKEVIDYLKHPQKYQRLGGKIPKGVLLVGPTGTGKTLLAKAVAGEAKVPFFSMSGSAFVEMFVGVGAARVRDLFGQAQEKAPCIIFIDELDALGKVRSIVPASGGHEERENTLNQLLVEMDGFDTRKGVIIMAATNRPEILDPALLRPGRFDRHILVDRPDIRGREEILHVHCKNIMLGKDVDLKIIAARTPGFVGADLANVVNEAALLAARMGRDAVGMENFEEAINRVVAGLEKRKRVMNKKEQEIIAYHESGHAIIAEIVPGADRVHRISIIPRGIAALGYTLQLPTEDRYILTKTELLDRLAVLLGGRAAEELIFHELSTGAQDDLERATNIAMSMVREYGMSEKIGPMSFQRRKPQFMELGYPNKESSEEISKEIDTEVKKIILDTYSKVKNILQENIDKLDILAKLLLEKEVIEGEELRKIMSQKILAQQ
ncbi:MAG: ATP-dependent zinc metalloprotease FtsH [Candidatus Loosdrechtia sp.]|uniref:ATP-dependent metallopeptidase FtsH/Yme1/Tma family protein n=1 Tax=Candidatus Loosdrechtia sp. TaxID=3101272 RepID=UPI003A659D56|nr:MAG: ATP-dependent zinc metalloprotease FtsH [Candidatus Jettenia sp. AMX2]